MRSCVDTEKIRLHLEQDDLALLGQPSSQQIATHGRGLSLVAAAVLVAWLSPLDNVPHHAEFCVCQRLERPLAL